MHEKNKDGKPRQWETLYDAFVVTESTGFKGRLMTGERKRRAAGGGEGEPTTISICQESVSRLLLSLSVCPLKSL